jgi:L-aminopeptidase/D-esterase-like protein
MADSITDIPGLRVGHWTDLEAATGCTVVLCEQGAVAGVDVRGAAPATRETDLLKPGSLVGRAYAILLTGGSAFGLDAATGVMRYLEERGVGYASQAGPVPIVPAAALFDLGIGRSDVRPAAAAGYAACQAAGETVAEGCVGAGTGATVAKLGGPGGAIKSGIGTACRALPDGTLVAALVAVNAVGGVYDPQTGAPLATPRTVADHLTADPLAAPSLAEPSADPRTGAALVDLHKAKPEWQTTGGTNTTIGVIATTARLDGGGVTRLALAGHDGLALAIRPAHTIFDGDALFALSLPAAAAPTATPADLLALGQAAAEVVAEAILRGVRAATPLHGIPSAQ